MIWFGVGLHTHFCAQLLLPSFLFLYFQSMACVFTLMWFGDRTDNDSSVTTV